MRHATASFVAIVALVTSAALLVGVLRANAVYFYCPFSQAIAERSCCAAPATHAEEDASSTSFVPIDCCQAKRIGSLPAGAVAVAPDVPAAPLLAIVPAVASPRIAGLAREAQRAFVLPNTGPPLRRPIAARTMVFLI